MIWPIDYVRGMDPKHNEESLDNLIDQSISCLMKHGFALGILLVKQTTYQFSYCPIPTLLSIIANILY